MLKIQSEKKMLGVTSQEPKLVFFEHKELLPS